MAQLNGDDGTASGIFPGSTYGVWGNTDAGWGVTGNSRQGNGLQGGSVNGFGAVGTSDTNHGVVAISNTAFGLYARGGAGAAFLDGNVQVTGILTADSDIVLKNADCAEDFEVANVEAIEPGSVVVIGSDGTLRESEEPYDKRVAGVLSGAGDCKPAIILNRDRRAPERRPVALMGRTYCKVDARYSSIEVGDLLTSSPTPGHAMKAGDPSRAFGAVIGKALQALRAGSGLIPILVALQ